MPDICPGCNIRVAPHDPLRVTRDDGVYHSTCLKSAAQDKKVKKEVNPNLVTIWNGGDFKTNLN